ncbi:tyrosine-specific transport protein-like isoform X1 [Oryza brachyantha]|uniref:tyrosine-specific transport protein-like isoform X1 n=2 Tax=Oryza brachyantha TaxID=4533 RepID=UPI001ADB9A64|nr:tyrosine-specific transport protein-like isoform X1 [Oryza brachyantha]
MQGALARALSQRAPHRCIPPTTTTATATRLPERRGLCGGSGGTVNGERARAAAAAVVVVRAAPGGARVGVGGPGVGDARPQQGEEDVGAGEAVPSSSSSCGGAKRGSVVGAAALVVGTSIGSGILAVPQRTAPAGFVPSAACMVTCWAFLVIEALLLAEINVHLRRKKGKDAGDGGGGGHLEVISLKSMAQETLGEWGGNLAAGAYLFLSYTSMVAYTSKSGEVLSRLIAGVPEPVSGGAFTAALALLIAAGGTGVTDKVNQLLTFVMIGLLLTIEVSAVASGAGLTTPANTNWEQVPATLPVIIFTLVFHDIAPVICAYLGGDLVRIRLSILVGSIVPLLSLLVWDDIALSVSTDLNGFDIMDMLKTEWSYTVVETFSLLAVGTSLIGTLLGASQFFIEQMANLVSSSAQGHEEEEGSRHRGGRAVDDNAMLSYIAAGAVVAPTVLIAATVPNSFSIATDIAGGYCMTILYGVLPPLMAWAITTSRMSDSRAGSVEAESSVGGGANVDLTSAKPVLVGMGVFSVLMVFEQMSQDLVSFQSYLLAWTG